MFIESNFKTRHAQTIANRKILGMLLPVREYRWIIPQLIAFLLKPLETSNGNAANLLIDLFENL